MQKKKSFTLIEILIASAIFTGIMVLSIASFSQNVAINGTSTQDRIVTQAARSFDDFISQQIKLNSTQSISDTDLGTCLAYQVGAGNGGCPNYSGTSYLLINKYDGVGKLIVADPNDNAYMAGSGVIIPFTESTTGNRDWYYIGKDFKDSNYPSNSTYAIYKTVGTNNVIAPLPSANWVLVNQITPSEATVMGLTFSGVSPRPLTFNADGSVASSSSGLQPFLNWQLQIAPSSDTTRVISFEAGVTSRDYKFAFPECSTSCQ